MRKFLKNNKLTPKAKKHVAESKAVIKEDDKKFINPKEHAKLITQEIAEEKAEGVLVKPKTKEQIKTEKKLERAKLHEGNKIQRAKLREMRRVKKRYAPRVIRGEIISTTNYEPDLENFIIELSNVQKSYVMGGNSYLVLKNISVKLRRGELIAITGPSGSGKTTFLNLISGLDNVDSGDIFVDGYNLSLLSDKYLTEFRRAKTSFVYQQYYLLPHLTAKENAEVGANLNRNKKNAMPINDIFKMIWLEGHMNKFPYQLSGGQQQRVSIARALAKEPSILFCDEPTGALDEHTGRVVLEALANINKKSKTTIIIVTHNPHIAKIANTVIKIVNGEIMEMYTNKNPLSASEIQWA